MDNRPIGFGLWCWRLNCCAWAHASLPHEEIVYIGDSARGAIWPRPAEQIREYTWQLVNFLLTKDVKMIVIACNTATAVVWEELSPVRYSCSWVILPGAQQLSKQVRVGNRSDWNTDDRTIRYLSTKIHDLDPDLQVESLACPNLLLWSSQVLYRPVWPRKSYTKPYVLWLGKWIV